jgi:TonB-dependent SusC/RagA subfamily outer membrane receptor
MRIFVQNDSRREIINKQLSDREILIAVAKSYNKRPGVFDKEQIPIHLINLDQPVGMLEYQAINPPVPVTSLKQLQPVNAPVLSSETKTSIALTEVVVVAMVQPSQPREVGYSVAKVRTNEISGSHPVYLQQALTGKISGLSVQQVNSGVFADTRITLRGIRSLTGNNEPLLVMDNNPLPLRLINSINPNDVLDVTILKGPAATAIYGPDGVNGALVIRTKKGSRFYSYSLQPYKLKNCDDMDYIEELKAISRTDKMRLYEQQKKEYGFEGVFYFEVAQHMYESGLIKEAKEILFSGAGITNGYPATIKAIAYMLESWKLFPEAIQVYGEILRKDSNDLSAWRNLALACYQDKQFQQCINIFYNGIRRAWPGMDSTAINMKASMLQEMNAIIAVHRKDLDLSFIEPALIRPVNIDMGITVESNDQTYSRASLLDFKGKNLKDVKSYNVMMPHEFPMKQEYA